jgi:hypothetical protein
MKRTALTIISFAGIVFGGMMMTFGNHTGDYVTVISCLIGLWLMHTAEHDCSDHEETLSRSYFRDGDTGVIFNTSKKVKCAKCGKTRTF